MKPLVSIIVPIYNCEKYIEKNLLSLIQQTYQEIEIILVNDGSTDGSEKKCKEYSKKDKRIRYYYQKNSGVSSARNYGIKRSKGEYIVFVDADDSLKPDFVEVMIKKITSKDYDMVGCKMVRVNEKGETLYQFDSYEPKEYSSKSAMQSFFLNKLPIGVWAKIFKKEFIKDIQFDCHLSNNEDKLFLFECLKKGKQYSLIDYVGYLYLNNENSASNIIKLKTIEDMLYVAGKINDFAMEKYPKYANIPMVLCELEICRSLIVSKKDKKYKQKQKEIIKDYKKRTFDLSLIENKKRKLELFLLKRSMILYKFFLNIYLLKKRVKK